MIYIRAMRTHLLAVLALTVLIGSQSARAEPPKLDLPADKPYTHEPSGFVFPIRVGEFDRISGYRYDETGLNISIGYNHKPSRIVMTAYVYPAGNAELKDHFDQICRDVTKAFPAAKEVSRGPWELKQGDKKYDGLKAVFSMRREFGGEVRELNSVAYLLKLGNQFIKFRVTYPADQDPEGADVIAQFQSALSLPEPKP
jgi:hypothetical protein